MKEQHEQQINDLTKINLEKNNEIEEKNNQISVYENMKLVKLTNRLKKSK